MGIKGCFALGCHTREHSLHRMVALARWGLAMPLWLRQIGLERLSGGCGVAGRVGWQAGWGGRPGEVAGRVGWQTWWGYMEGWQDRRAGRVRERAGSEGSESSE